MKKILLTGGHAGTTGLSVIKELKKQSSDIEISWIGVRKAVTGSLADTLEYKIYPKYGVKFYPFDVGKVQTKFTKYTIPLFLKIPISFIQIFIRAIKIRPDVIVSFGGSASLPVTFYGYLFRIPVIIHEQTSVAGRANLVASKFAKVIAISRRSSEKYYADKKIVLTGNPLAQSIIKYLDKKPRQFVRNILFTGGSRGSIWLNNALLPIVFKLSKKYKIYWQVGENNLEKIKVENPNIKIFGQLDPDEMIEIIADSDIVISRSGANTVSELIALKKPSILIPIPWLYLNEQTENAKQMENLGLCRILPQKDLNPINLERSINMLIKDYSEIISKTRKLISEDIGASKKLVGIIIDELYEKEKS